MQFSNIKTQIQPILPMKTDHGRGSEPVFEPLFTNEMSISRGLSTIAEFVRKLKFLESRKNKYLILLITKDP